MAHISQSRPDSGLGFQVKVLKPFQVVASSLGSGLGCELMQPGFTRGTLPKVNPGTQPNT